MSYDRGWRAGATENEKQKERRSTDFLVGEEGEVDGATQRRKFAAVDARLETRHSLDILHAHTLPA